MLNETWTMHRDGDYVHLSMDGWQQFASIVVRLEDDLYDHSEAVVRCKILAQALEMYKLLKDFQTGDRTDKERLEDVLFAIEGED